MPLGRGWSGQCCRRRRRQLLMMRQMQMARGRGGSPGCAWRWDRQDLTRLRRRLVSDGLTQKTRNVPDWVPVVLTIWLVWRRYWAPPSCAVSLGILAASSSVGGQCWAAGWAARASGGDGLTGWPVGGVLLGQGTGRNREDWKMSDETRTTARQQEESSRQNDGTHWTEGWRGQIEDWCS